MAVKISATPKTSGMNDPRRRLSPPDQANDTGRQSERGAHPAVDHTHVQCLGPAHDEPQEIGGQQAADDSEYDHAGPSS